jgi:hypothetical protein
MSVEVYCARAGQSLKEGEMSTLPYLSSRDEARSDAEGRCRRDPAIAKVAYYTIAQSGDFRLYFTYTNPRPVTAAAKPRQATSARGGGDIAGGGRPRAPAMPTPGLWARLTAFFSS